MTEKTVYLYDGTYSGLLTLLFRLSKKPDGQLSIQEERLYQPSLFEITRPIATDPREAAWFLEHLKKAFSPQVLKNMFRVFLSNAPDRELLIWRYISFGFQVKDDLDSFLTDQRVKPVHDYARKVSGEAHRMRGLVRFRQLEDSSYYAPIKTDHYVLPLITPYFSRRLNGKRWFIHDVARKKIAIYNGKRYQFADVVEFTPPVVSPQEKEYQAMWRHYFRDIAIGERTNLKVQRQFMPKRYWKYLTETEDIHSES